MTLSFRGTILGAATGLLLSACAGWSNSSPADQGQVAQAVARLLEQGHYSRQKLNDEMSEKIFENYLRLLDYNRLYFTQQDIDSFRQKYGTSFDDALLRGDLTPAQEIYDLFRERVESRIKKNKELAAREFKFDSDRTVEINRQKADWPKDEAEADRLWADRIEAELLQEHLSETRIDPPVKVLTRRYDQILRNVRDQEYEDMVKTFLTALAQAYDPHSDYLSPSDMENFAISMRLSLVGVGAVLRSEDGYAKVMEVVPGGPADRDGRLQVNDRIAAVAQGEEDFEDVVDMKLDKVVERIRGKKGTNVRLLVVPADATDPSKRDVIEIVRDEVQLKDQEAKAELIEFAPQEGQPAKRIGWITLPSFYANMDRKPGSPPKSTTEDVSRLLTRLNKEGIRGLVIDLRRDGGGSLEEAVKLTGLFVPPGPVVQAKDANGRISVSRDDSSQIYDGPLIVLMNRLSASASEIFAAALQDYGRAVIVGDERSFGKGTVQQVVDVGRYMPFFSLAASDAGSLKLTVQKFYRVGGGSTQLNGVESDIVLPSLTDTPEIGEGALTNPLEYDEVSPLPVDRFLGHDLYLSTLRERSAARLQPEPEFQFIAEDITRLKARLDENQISLNKELRKAEIAADKARREGREQARLSRGPALAAQAYELTLDNVDAPELQLVAFDRRGKNSKSLEDEELVGEVASSEAKADESKPAPPDAIRNETLLIMRDFIELSGRKKTARVDS